MKRIKSLSIFTAILIFIASGSIAGHAQTTEFSYQGNVNNNAANGNFDFEFRLFDTSSGGTLIGSQRLAISSQRSAISDQQKQIEAHQKENAEQKAINQKLQSQFDGLKKVVCNSNPSADICMKKE